MFMCFILNFAILFHYYGAAAAAVIYFCRIQGNGNDFILYVYNIKHTHLHLKRVCVCVRCIHKRLFIQTYTPNSAHTKRTTYVGTNIVKTHAHEPYARMCIWFGNSFLSRSPGLVFVQIKRYTFWQLFGDGLL